MKAFDTPAVTRARDILDSELETFIRRVYVGGGFTSPELAASALTGAGIRARGDLWIARDDSGALAGTVIVVAPTSAARRIAASHEAELHLLAVAPEHRGRGLGARLIRTAIDASSAAGFSQLVLWTQPTMLAAQRLYVAQGFVRAPERDEFLPASPGRTFHVYQRRLSVGR